MKSSYTRYRRGYIFAFTLMLCGAGSQLPNFAADKIASNDRVFVGSAYQNGPVTSAYHISPGDVLSFSINEEPDFDQKSMIVRSDGFVTIKPLGEIAVAGMTIDQLTHTLEGQLSPYVKVPKVYIDVLEFHTPTVYLFGEVMRPGQYQPFLKTPLGGPNVAKPEPVREVEKDSRLTISRILGNSGGVKYDADLSKILLTHLNGETKLINLINLFVSGDQSQDVLIEEGDTIQIPKLIGTPYGDDVFQLLTAAGIYPEQFPIRVLGEVQKPGLYYLASDSPGVNSAIAMAGGYTTEGVKRQIIICRKARNDDLSKIVLNPEKIDFVLRPDDIVEIKDSKFKQTVRGAETASRIGMPFIWLYNWF